MEQQQHRGVATVDTSGNVYGVSAGTAIISYSLGTCTVAAIVTVNATPAPIGGVTEVCVGLATRLSDATTGGTWSSTNTAIASVVATSGILTGASPGTALITYTLPDGCSATTIETVDTTPPVITGTAHVCPGSTSTLADGGGGSWSSSNTAVATIGSAGVVSAVTVGTASIVYSIGAGCFISTTVTVNPLPPAISGITTLCAGSTTTLSDGSGSWASSNAGIVTIGSVSGTVGGLSGGTATITYTASTTGCTARATVTVNPLPLAIIGTLFLCPGTTVLLVDRTLGGVWSSNNTSIASIGTAGIVTGISPGTSVISYTNPVTGCSIHAIATINPLPAAITVGTLAICAGETTTLIDATTGGLWTSSSGSIAAVIPTSGIVSGAMAGTAIISYTLPTGCARAAIVTVNAIPTITGPTAECVGAIITESESPAGGTWSSSVTTVATVVGGSVTGITTGITIITYTSPAGCKASTTITVSLSPSAIIGASSVCTNDTTTLSDAVGGGVWSSTNTAAATIGSLNGTVTGVAVGTTIITYSLGTGCTVTKMLTVNASPAAITGTTSVCIGATTTLADATTGGVWSPASGGIAIVSGGLVTGGSVGIDTIFYTHGGCSVNTIVTVNPTPSVIGGTAHVCLGDSTTLSDAVTGGVWSPASGGIASIDLVGNLHGISSGTALITYSLGAGCAVTEMVTVNPISTITGSLGLCLGTTTALADAITGGSWGSGTTTVASVNTAGIVTGVLEGTSIITYTLAAGCSTTAVVTVNLAPSPISGTLHVCVGATTALGNTAGGGIWASSNTIVATISSTGILTGIIPGTTAVTYSLGFGCTVNTIVTVNAVPLGISGTAIICAGTTTILSDASTGGAWSPASGGIATVSGIGIVYGVSAGTAEISYSLVTGCAAIATITVNPQPATTTGTTHICVGLTTILSSTSGGTWSTTSSGIATADPVTGMITGVAPGTAVITYTLPAGCSTTATITINSAPAAIAGYRVPTS